MQSFLCSMTDFPLDLVVFPTQSQAVNKHENSISSFIIHFENSP